MSKITFKDGLPGFKEYTEYQIILNEDTENPFQTLQSLEEEELAFTIIDPFTIKPSYDFTLSESTIEKLEIEDVKDLAVYTIVTIPNEYYKNVTVNLLAPIIINTKNRLAKQIILSETDYKTKHQIVDIVEGEA